jgi:hypothetical protein
MVYGEYSIGMFRFLLEKRVIPCLSQNRTFGWFPKATDDKKRLPVRKKSKGAAWTQLLNIRDYL